MPEHRPIKGLGEIAFRVEDLDRMQEFYENVVGLELMRRFPDSAFFRIAEGVAGHTQILALFDRRARVGYQGIESEHTTVDHIAFGIALEDHQAGARAPAGSWPEGADSHARVDPLALHLHLGPGGEHRRARLL